MNEKTKEALEGSINKWYNIVIGKEVDKGANNCPLCKVFFDKDCWGCPVRNKTGEMNCYNSPYLAFVDAYENEVEELAGSLYLEFTPRVVGPKSQEAAINEYNFLCSLREE